jgi:spore germination cell wall hydrolase CwlJ-like protein
MKTLLASALLVSSFSIQAAPTYDANDTLYLADTLYCEARGEGKIGMMAVADVIVNRVESNRWPNTVYEVTRQKYQFSCINDGKKQTLKIDEDSEEYEMALYIADIVLKGKAPRITYATHYHTTDIKPTWSKSKEITKLGLIGNHVFYDYK